MTTTPAIDAAAPETGAAIAARLDALDTPGAMKSALLALLLRPDRPARLALWREETASLADADAIREDVERLPALLRIPLYERLLARHGGLPLAERRRVLQAARRVLAAPLVPIDRLLWLAMRRAFGERSAARDAGVAAEGASSELPLAELLPIAHFTAHLARLVPGGEAAGQDWYRAALADWFRSHEVPDWKRPDVDLLVAALGALQAMPMVRRPQVVRRWVTAATGPGRPPLAREAADALRLSCLLLDCPVPPELQRQFGTLPSEQA